jgi:hypothetical protein
MARQRASSCVPQVLLALVAWLATSAGTLYLAVLHLDALQWVLALGLRRILRRVQLSPDAAGMHDPKQAHGEQQFVRATPAGTSQSSLQGTCSRLNTT